MSTTEKLHFTYDPIFLTKHLLQRYTETHLEKALEVKATKFACYKYLHTVTDEEVESLLLEYVANEKIDAITFKKWEHDCKCIFECIFKRPRFIQLEFEYKKQGYSLTGLGVVDKSDNTFYDCSFAHHWATVQKILEEKYPNLHEAFIEMTYEDTNLIQYKEVSRESLDSFLLNNFELIGNRNSLESYV